MPITAVSSILRSDNKHKSGRKSAALSSRNASAKQMFATDSGIKVHRAINTFLSTGEVDLEEKHFPYFRNIYEQLEVLEPPDIIWNEGPVRPEHQHLRQGEYSSVWDRNGASKIFCITDRYGCDDAVTTVLFASEY